MYVLMGGEGGGGNSAQCGGVNNLPSLHCSTSQSPPLFSPLRFLSPCFPWERNSYSSQTTTSMVNVKKTLYYTSILHLFSFRLFFTTRSLSPIQMFKVYWKKNSESPSRVGRKSGRLNMPQKVKDFLASLGITTPNFGFPLIKLGGS